jgi:uncharacterized membrane protein
VLGARLLEIFAHALGEQVDLVLVRTARFLGVGDEVSLVHVALGVEKVVDFDEIVVPVRNLQEPGTRGICCDDPGYGHEDWTIMNRLLFGGALGAAAMYFLDPHSGRRRRARTRDKAVHASRVLSEAGRVTARDAQQRVSGLIAGTKRLFRHEEVPDEVLVGRVRAALGRVVSHPHAVEVFVNAGHVSLSGPVLAHEARLLVRTVRAVGGVRAVSDELTAHEDASHVSALQGGIPRTGQRFELLQDNWSPAVRLAAGLVGAGLVLSASRAKGGLCALLGVTGGTLVARAATNLDLATLAGFGERGITVRKTIHVDAAPPEVFAFWSDPENFPRFMRHVREVQPLDGHRSRWTVAGPAGVPLHWTAEVTQVEPGRLIEWCCSEDSDVWHQGCVTFDDNGHGGTRVQVEMSYVPPAGAFGHAVASLFGADPKSEMDADLMRMKSTIESGHPPHDAARRAPQAES